MFSLKAEKREKVGRQVRTLRKHGLLPAVLYGEGVKNIPLRVSEKDFEKVFAQAGTSSLVSLELGKEKYQVLVYDFAKDPLTEKFLHIDFYRPSTKKETTVEAPLVFEGEEESQKISGGNLIKEIQTVEVKGLAQNLPREIVVDLKKLKKIDDRFLVKDLEVPQDVSILRDKEDIVALLVEPRAEEEIGVEAPTEEEKEKKEKEKKEEEAKEEKEEQEEQNN